MDFVLTGYKLTENHCLDDFLSFVPHRPPTQPSPQDKGQSLRRVFAESLTSWYLNKVRQEGGSGLRKARRLPSVGRRGDWWSSQTWVRSLLCCLLALHLRAGCFISLSLSFAIRKIGASIPISCGVARMKWRKANTQRTPASITLCEDLLVSVNCDSQSTWVPVKSAIFVPIVNLVAAYTYVSQQIG